MSNIKKRSVLVGNRKTSISLEDEFWEPLTQIARLRGLSVSDLILQIDERPRDGGLSSACRAFVLRYYQDLLDDEHGDPEALKQYRANVSRATVRDTLYSPKVR